MNSKHSLMAVLAGLTILGTPQLSAPAHAEVSEIQEDAFQIAQNIQEISPNFDSNGLFSISA
ncbi:MAG: hypothetical protein HC810_03290, partial [Acaryochloridaceae cyanobacterium RL_2_7]|nr:hypothetical protein [Acaryochloridaceae cyanobacterium RL_2_7]